MARKAKKKSFFEMTDEERTEDVKKFDREFIIDEFRPMNAKEKAQWERIKLGPPLMTKVISVRLENVLLKKADKLAKKWNLSRSGLISSALLLLIAEYEAEQPPTKPRRRAVRKKS